MDYLEILSIISLIGLLTYGGIYFYKKKKKKVEMPRLVRQPLRSILVLLSSKPITIVNKDDSNFTWIDKRNGIALANFDCRTSQEVWEKIYGLTIRYLITHVQIYGDKLLIHLEVIGYKKEFNQWETIKL